MTVPAHCTFSKGKLEGGRLTSMGQVNLFSGGETLMRHKYLPTLPISGILSQISPTPTSLSPVFQSCFFKSLRSQLANTFATTRESVLMFYQATSLPRQNGKTAVIKVLSLRKISLLSYFWASLGGAVMGAAIHLGLVPAHFAQGLLFPPVTRPSSTSREATGVSLEAWKHSESHHED